MERKQYKIDDDGYSEEARLDFIRIVGGRERTDPSNKWSTLTPPLTDEQVEEAEWAAGHICVQYSPASYTCGSCPDRYVCPCLFDPYNTGGDCLMSK